MFENITSSMILMTTLCSSILGGATVVIAIVNPIHSILILISVFIMGSAILYLLNLEYFAILFLVVYVGAIVVLFLFIVMMLDLKFLNEKDRFRDIFSYRHIVIPILLILISLFLAGDSSVMFDAHRIEDSIVFSESNIYTDYSKLLTEMSQLRALGPIIFQDYGKGVLIIALLLFLSMISAIVLSFDVRYNLKHVANKIN